MLSRAGQRIERSWSLDLSVRAMVPLATILTQHRKRKKVNLNRKLNAEADHLQ